MLKLTFHPLATLPANNSCCLRGLEGKTVIFANAGFWPRGQNPRRHPRSPRVYIYKEFQKCKDVSKSK